MRTFARWAGLLGLACLVFAGTARGEEKAKGEADKLDLESLLNLNKEEVIKTDMEEAGEGDNQPFTVKTDDDISALEAKDVYRNDEKTFFEVSEITSKGSKGGTFVVKRTRGKGEAGQRYTRVSGKGPYVITTRLTLLDLYQMGGPFLHPIACLMVVMFVMAINSIWIYRRGRQIQPGFVSAARAALEKGDVSRMEELALRTQGLFPQICRAMAEGFESSTIPELRARVEAAAGRAVTRLKIPVKALNLIAAAAPLLGLLGTIIGMVIVFEAVATSTGVSKATALAAGIRVKLFCTAFALMVAIPSLFMFFIFNQRLNMLVAECETLSEQFIQKLSALKRRTAGLSAAGEGEDAAGAPVSGGERVAREARP